MTGPVNLLAMQLQHPYPDGQSASSSGASAGGVPAADAPAFRELLRECLEQAVRSGGLGGAAGFETLPLSGGVSVNDGRPGDMQASGSLVEFVAAHEGYSAAPYRGADVQNLTVGYGHVVGEGENISSLTRSQALGLLKSDLASSVASVNREFAGTPLTQQQFDALVSFAYNLGDNIWSRAPKLTADIRDGADAQTLRADFTQFDHCNGQELRGLYNRRVDEWELFTSGTYRTGI